MNLANEFKNKRVLVAGGAGFVGTNLVKKLYELGAMVRATFHNKKPQFVAPEIEIFQVDLTNKDDCRRTVKDIDYVFMWAAVTSGAYVIENTPLVHVTPNVIMNALMLEASYEAGVKKFIWPSSNTVYPPSDLPIKEEEWLSGEPFSKYFSVAWMKRFGEIMCDMYSRRIKNPMPSIILRPANIYGEYDDFEWETSHMMPALIRKVVERHNPIEIWGDGKDIKDLIYVGDFVKGVLMATIKLNAFTPLNIGTGRPASVLDVLSALLELENYKQAKIVFNTAKPSMIPKRLLDVSKAKEILNFDAKTSLQDGLKRTIEWYKATHPNGYNSNSI